MPFSNTRVDLSKLPDDLREVCIHIAEKHNALVDGATDVKIEMDRITGSSREEKAEMHNAFDVLKKTVHVLHQKRFNVTLFSIQAYLGIMLLKQLGLDSAILNDLFKRLVHLLPAG